MDPLWLVLFATSVVGLLVDRIIDDQNGDEVTGAQVQYIGSWNQGSTCGGCASRPDKNQAHAGTWHDGFRVPSHNDPPLGFSFKFTGNAFRIYCIQPRNVLTNVDISVDGAKVGNYNRALQAPDTQQYLYNVAVYSQSGMPYGDHTVTVMAAGTQDDLVLFDYAVYTTDDGKPDPQAPPPPPPQSPTTTSQTTQPNTPGQTSNPVETLIQSQTTTSLATTTKLATITESAPLGQTTSHSDGHGQGQGQGQGSDGAGAGTDKHKINLGAIVGGVIGGLGLLIFILISLWLYRRHNAQRYTVERQDRMSLSPLPLIRDPPSEKSTSVVDLVPTRARSTTSLTEIMMTPMTPTTEHMALSDIPQTTALQQQLQFFRSELERLRSRSQAVPEKAMSETATSDFSGSRRSENSTQLIAALTKELANLRREMSDLRAQQEFAPAQGLGSDDLHRELHMLRGEIEDLRLQQNDPLPEYSPPPPALRPPSFFAGSSSRYPPAPRYPDDAGPSPQPPQ
ncbi:hypothetical protein BXZ70DRAFT_286208 [Cristinia sonorae]|uniref:Uncharacterized protein n=1 Tax=Cristinia sonorae TaxID=1940300 RepID=A0A8K0UXG6_9AGAR|nr:hypothetical protein BXZ70DRAFT_286208 [Cristinia sonorae]